MLIPALAFLASCKSPSVSATSRTAKAPAPLVTPEALAESHADFDYIPLVVHPQSSVIDCGPAVLAATLNHWFPDALPHSATSLSQGNPPASLADGYSLAELTELATLHGARATVINPEKSDLPPHELLLGHLRKGRPLILPLREPSLPIRPASLDIPGSNPPEFLHYHLLIGLSPDASDTETYLLADPLRGLHTLSRRDLYSRWNPAQNLFLLVAP